MNKVICNTKFRLDPFADGGSKRSVQIREILQTSGIEYEDDSFTLPKGLKADKLIQLAFRSFAFIWRYYPKKRIHSFPHFIKLIKYYALRLPIVYDKYVNKDIVFLWENTNDRDLVYLLKATGHRAIGLPHNIESLVHSQTTDGLKEELDCLKECDAVYTISKEETWLLRLFGLNAHYLPYYPPKDVEVFLKGIKEKRNKRSSKDCKQFTILGSATNIHTRLGMQQIIDCIASRNVSFDLSIAGYGTESLIVPNNPRLFFKGTLSNDELENLLVSVDGIIIYQPPTTGALTRIAEMQVAGIPVFANFDACRDYHNIDGVYLYDSFDDLLLILNSFNPTRVNININVRPKDSLAFIGSINL